MPRHLYMGQYQWLQTPTRLVQLSEETNAYRTIILDGRPHLGKDLVVWQGDSRGRWEGNTLVVVTKNQVGRGWLDQQGRFITDAATVTERFTMFESSSILWEITIDDPLVYTRPFTMASALRRNMRADFEIWEESCYEEEAVFSQGGAGREGGLRACDIHRELAMKPRILMAFALAAGLLASSALAHHSLTVEFDINRMVTVSGVITEMKWTNPHAWLYIDVKDEKGITFRMRPRSNTRGGSHGRGRSRCRCIAVSSRIFNCSTTSATRIWNLRRICDTDKPTQHHPGSPLFIHGSASWHMAVRLQRGTGPAAAPLRLE